MSKYGSSSVAFLLVDGYSLLGVTTDFEEHTEALLVDSTVLGTSWSEAYPSGLRKASFSQNGFFDDAAGSSNAALVSNTGISRILAYGIAGNTIGRGFVGFSGAMQVDYKRRPARGDLHRANASYVGNGQVDNGLILHAVGAETTATGNTQASSIDNGAASALGGAVYLEVPALALGGYTSVSVVVSDSADNAAWADLAGGTFAVVTAAPNAQRLAISGSIRRYTSVRWAFNGAGAGQSVTFMCGVVRS